VFADRDLWVFDLDGTLTIANHDFDALRAALGIPAGEPILEWIATRPGAEADALTVQLDALEAALAAETRPQPGVVDALAALVDGGCRLGVLTRNTRANAHLSLERIGVDDLFDPACVLGREDARPKPDPDGILRLLDHWGGAPERGVMVGDFRFDLEAGRAAGTACVHFSPTGDFPWPALADARIRRLDEVPALRG
jgi:HAD superfamily hydrolase (TIGR01509 family)